MTDTHHHEPTALADLPSLLAFERQWASEPAHDGRKEQAIRDRFRCGPTRYYQTLNAALDGVEALAADPILVGRLRRIRDRGLTSRRERGRRLAQAGSDT